jgi:hypothetical protein
MKTPDSGKPCDKCGAMIRFRKLRDGGRLIAIDYHPSGSGDLVLGYGGRFAKPVYRLTSENELVLVESIHDQASALWVPHRQTCKPDVDPDPRQGVIA